MEDPTNRPRLWEIVFRTPGTPADLHLHAAIGRGEHQVSNDSRIRVMHNSWGFMASAIPPFDAENYRDVGYVLTGYWPTPEEAESSCKALVDHLCAQVQDIAFLQQVRG